MSDPKKNRVAALAALVQRHGQSALAERVRKAPSQISDMLNGRKSFGEKVARSIERMYAPGLVAGWMDRGEVPDEEGLDISPANPRPDLTGGDVLVWNHPDDLPPDEDRVWVDRWDYSCSAGDGMIQWEIRQKDALPFTGAFFKAIGAKAEHCKLISVRGDSMEPFLFDKDMMMVDTSKTEIRDGKVYAICFETEPLVKRIFRQAGGVLTLHSYNPAYPDKTVEPGKVTQFEVIGEVVYRSGAGFAGA